VWDTRACRSNCHNFYLLQKGKPKFEYEYMKSLLQYLQVKNRPQKHWSTNIGWSMVKIMHDISKATINKL
jgi:hypothetical protein